MTLNKCSNLVSYLAQKRTSGIVFPISYIHFLNKMVPTIPLSFTPRVSCHISRVTRLFFLLKSERTIEEKEKQTTECKSGKFQGWVTTT